VFAGGSGRVGSLSCGGRKWQQQFNYFINCKVDVGADDVYDVTVIISSLC